MYKKDLAEVLLNLSKGTVDLAVKKLYDAISEKEVNISQAKDKIKFDVHLDIEVPDDTTRKFTEILLLQKIFSDACVFWKKYKKKMLR